MLEARAKPPSYMSHRARILQMCMSKCGLMCVFKRLRAKIKHLESLLEVFLPNVMTHSAASLSTARAVPAVPAGTSR